MHTLLLFLFSYINPIHGQSLSRHDVLITEIMADPNPSAGLPLAEYIELKNVSGRQIQMAGWRISDGTTTGIITENITLAADSQIALTTKTHATELGRFGRSIGISPFPSLDNAEDRIILLSPDGQTIHAISYHLSWYQHALKSAGGWSLEMRDTDSPCLGIENWAASISTYGGTPGSVNSVIARVSDTIPPGIQYAYARDSLTLILRISESIDSSQAAAVWLYRALDGLGNPIQARPIQPFFSEIELRMGNQMQQGLIYRIEVHGLKDCHGNLMRSPATVRAGRAGPVVPGQLRINEILFNPKADGSDFVEWINLGPGIIDASEIYLANRQGNGQPTNIFRCSDYPRPVFPGDYATFSSDTCTLQKQYNVRQPEMLIQMETMPSFPDDAGHVMVLDKNGVECDAYSYRHTDHFALLAEREGVSLERINPRGPSQYKGNWHSAASDVGYATPTYQNSQFQNSTPVSGELQTHPSVISPDMDGRDDTLIISYRFEESGWSCSVAVTDPAGRVVRYLARNMLCGQSGVLGWDGLSENHGRLQAGLYYLVFEAFHIQGQKRIWKKSIGLTYK